MEDNSTKTTKYKKPGDPAYFACSCTEEGKNECDQLLEKVKSLLSADDSDLLTKVILALEFNYNANITSIASDMWSGIRSQTEDYDMAKRARIEPPIFSTYIQCDKLEYGIAATWLAYYEKFGEQRPDIDK